MKNLEVNKWHAEYDWISSQLMLILRLSLFWQAMGMPSIHISLNSFWWLSRFYTLWNITETLEYVRCLISKLLCCPRHSWFFCVVYLHSSLPLFIPILIRYSSISFLHQIDLSLFSVLLQHFFSQRANCDTKLIGQNSHFCFTFN